MIQTKDIGTSSSAYARLVVLLSTLALSACGGGGDGGSGLLSDGPDTSAGQQADPTTGGQGQNSPGAGTDPTQVQPPNQAPVAGGASDDFPFPNSVFVADEYEAFTLGEIRGAVEISVTPLSLRRLVSGSKARRLSDGQLLFRQPCGDRVFRFMIADTNLRFTQITPCSSEIGNPGASPTFFDQAALSPDGSRIAVEVVYFQSSDTFSTIMVFDVGTRESLVVPTPGRGPTWYTDGRLLFATNDGLRVMDASLQTQSELSAGQTGFTDNPAISPDGTAIAYEFNQAIWVANSDGSDPREAVFSSKRLRFPVWSPDSTAKIAYLAVENEDKYDPAVYVTDFVTNQSYALSVESVLTESAVWPGLIGPLTWTIR